MAIDSAAKRASAMFPGLPWLRPLPPPDGAIGQADRQAVSGWYGGILAEAFVLEGLCVTTMKAVMEDTFTLKSVVQNVYTLKDPIEVTFTVKSGVVVLYTFKSEVC